MYKIIRRKDNAKINFPYYSKEALEVHALKILAEFDKNLINNPSPIPIEDIIEQYYNLNIDYKTLSQDGSILGLTVFETGYLKVYDPDCNMYYPIEVRSGTIIIDNTLVENADCYGRYRFTCGHEFSHWELHKSLFFTNSTSNTEDKKHIKCLNRDIGNSIGRSNKTPKEWIEWQADYLSAAILMPHPTVKEYYNSCREKLEKQNMCEESRCKITNEIIDEMAAFFEVSKKAMRTRLKEMTLIP